MISYDRAALNSEINDLLAETEATIPREMATDLPYMKQFPDVHEWHDFELKIWDMGEKIRQFAVPDSNKLIYNDLCRLAKK